MGTDDMHSGHENEVESPQGHPHSEHDTHDHGHDHGHHHEEPMTPEEAVRSLILLAQVALESGDYESAAVAYASVLELEQNEIASYSLATLYARGSGVRQDFLEAARLFHQAELLGNKRAGKLCGKCLLDYVQDGFEDKSPMDLYVSMAIFVTRVYPEAADQKQEVARGLMAIGSAYFNTGDYDKAAKAFRAAAEFSNDGYAQYNLAVLYNAGSGVPRNDLVALYWLDRAVDNGAADMALKDRDGILAAYRQSLAPAEFREAMAMLADWCESGTPDVPADQDRAERWRGVE